MSIPQKSPVRITIPAGKTAIVNFANNSSAKESFRITDSNGKEVCSGAGTGTGPKVQPSQTFVAEAGGIYKVSIDSYDTPNMILDSNSSMVSNGIVYAQSYLFISEDASDNDYNDTFLNISWFQNNG